MTVPQAKTWTICTLSVAEHPREEQQPQASERGQREERAMKRLLQPPRDGLAVALMDDRKEDPRDERVEAGVGSKVERAVEDRRRSRACIG